MPHSVTPRPPTAVSARAEYGCLAMLELAARHGDPRPVRLVELAAAHGIPQSFLVQILLQLRSAGLIASTRGIAGGYQLTRTPDAITLADVLDVIDRSETKFHRPPRTSPSPLADSLHGLWDEMAADRQKLLEATTLASLVEAGHDSLYVI